MMNTAADVVIVGGGIQGLSLAYHLARLGLNDVCLVEMNSLGSGSSGRSAAIIGYAFQTESCLPLSQWSFSAYARFHEELGADPGYVPIGCLLLASADRSSMLRERYQLLRRLGINSKLTDRQAILALTPALNLEDIEVGLYNAREGCIDPHSIMMAYARQARRLGVACVEGVEAIGLQARGGRVVGVDTTSGAIATGCVVNAAGFRARQVAAWAGLELPITNLKRHIFFTGPVPAYRDSIPFTYEVDPAWYMRREGPGLLIGMGAVQSYEEDPQVDWSFLDTVIEHSLYRAPALETATVQSGWAGFRPATPDDDPILGPVSHLEGFFCDCGWGGHGIMNAPAAGRALAEWIAHGNPSCVDITCFSAERFVGGEETLLDQDSPA
jgi:sarcosine oxidase subunit beta